MPGTWMPRLGRPFSFCACLNLPTQADNTGCHPQWGRADRTLLVHTTISLPASEHSKAPRELRCSRKGLTLESTGAPPHVRGGGTDGDHILPGKPLIDRCQCSISPPAAIHDLSTPPSPTHSPVHLPTADLTYLKTQTITHRVWPVSETLYPLLHRTPYT